MFEQGPRDVLLWLFDITSRMFWSGLDLESNPTPAGWQNEANWLKSNIKPRQISYAVELGSDVLTRQTTSRSPSEMARSVFGQYEWWWKLPLRHGMRSCSDERCRGPVPPCTTNLVGRRLVAGSRSLDIQGGFFYWSALKMTKVQDP